MVLRNRNWTICRPASSAGRPRNWLRSGAIALAIGSAGLAASCLLSSQAPNLNQPILPPDAVRTPDPNAQMVMPEQQAKKETYQSANLERKRQIADDSAKLLKLASDLKTEVDKTSKDTLSLGVIRKADEIEKLAHSVREKMKLTVGGN